MSAHTPEPWKMNNSSIYAQCRGLDTQVAVADTFWIGQAEAEANARRIVTCVNACAGIPTEELVGVARVEGCLVHIARLERINAALVEAAKAALAQYDARTWTDPFGGSEPAKSLRAALALAERDVSAKIAP